MPALKTEESAAQRNNQSGKGLKVLVPNQMLSTHSLYHNYQPEAIHKNLKNDIRQLLYSLYSSKKLTKIIY